MKLSKQQIEQLRRSNLLVQITHERLAQRIRLAYHAKPVLPENATNEQKQAYNEAVSAQQNALKIEPFTKIYIPQIRDWQSTAKLIFVLALADYDYSDIHGLTDNALVEAVAQAETPGGNNILDRVIEQSFQAVKFPPKPVEIV